jgi:hypothetical protein
MSAALSKPTPVELIQRRDEVLAAYIDGCETGSMGMMPAEAIAESWRYSDTLKRLSTARRHPHG